MTAGNDRRTGCSSGFLPRLPLGPAQLIAGSAIGCVSCFPLTGPEVEFGWPLEYWFRMLRSLMSRLNSPRPQQLPADDSRLALAVLLVRVGRSDDTFSEDEQDRTDRILSTRYGLSLADAAELRREAEQLESEVADNVSFTRALKKAVPFEERESLVEALWEVVMADQHRDYAEDGFLRLTAKLLGVNDRDSALARQKVIARMK